MTWKEHKKAAAEDSRKKWLRIRSLGYWVVGGLAVAVGLYLFTLWLTEYMRDSTSGNTPVSNLSSVDSIEKQTSYLRIPPGGRSELVSVPPEMHPVMDGDDFRLVNVYRDGSECSGSCPDGPLRGTYAMNLDLENSNTVALRFARKR